jgi:hypothetical protein
VPQGVQVRVLFSVFSPNFNNPPIEDKTMEELKSKLAEVLNLDDEMAQKGVDTVVSFLKEKLPENLHGLLDNLEGGGVDVAENALDAVKGLFGGK